MGLHVPPRNGQRKKFNFGLPITDYERNVSEDSGVHMLTYYSFLHKRWPSSKIIH